jgi:hypothetical protein
MNRPEFNDAFAKERARKHNAFGGMVVEIFYGAKDADGNPTETREGADDGHGRWFGIRCNDDYTMFVWEHSRDEGGAVEYGTEYGEEAVKVMEAQLEEKRGLCARAENIARNYEGDDGEEKLQEIRAEWDQLKDWGTPKDAELNVRLEKAFAEYAPRAEQIKENKAAKQAVVDRIEDVRAIVNFKEAREKAKELLNELSEIGSAGDANDDMFRKMVRDLQKDIEKRFQEYRENIDANRAVAKEKKEHIIQSSRNILANVSNWKAAADQLNGLFTDWKAAGSAGHDDDDALWSEFNSIRDEFYAKRKEFFNARNEKFKKSIETKKALIEEAGRIAETKDYSRENTERMKKLDVEWKAAGYSGKDENDRLWEEFSTVKETFWDGKKAMVNARFQTELDEKTAQCENLKKQVSDLEDRITTEENPNLKEGFKKEVYIKKSQINDLEDRISVLKDKIR